MSRSKIAVIVAALAVVAIAIFVIGWKLGGGAPDEGSRPERVRLEIRAKPIAKIRVDGKEVGQTPVSIYVPRTTQPIKIEALMEEHVMALGQQPTSRPREMTKMIVPDRDQLIDFIPPPMRVRRPD